MRSEGYSSRSVCRLFWNYTLLLLLRQPENKNGDFPETTAFERYVVRTSEKANMLNRAGLPRPPRTLEAQEVTTEGVYRLPHAIY